jgi:hypothetical protein
MAALTQDAGNTWFMQLDSAQHAILDNLSRCSLGLAFQNVEQMDSIPTSEF